MPTSQYEIPPYGTGSDRLLGWCLEAQQEGEAWLKTQRPTRGWDADLLMLSDPDGADSAPTVAGMSNVGYNKGKRVARELVASLSNFRHEGEYKVTWDQSLYDVAHTLTNLDRHWYRTTLVNAEYRRGLQYAVGMGTTYFWETWDRHFWGPYRGDIRLQALSPADVTFVQLPKDHNLQRAYAVIIREELPINLAKAMYADLNGGAFAAALVPDRDAPGVIQRGLRKVQQFLAPALRVGGRLQRDAAASFPMVDVFHMYTLDRSVNLSPFPVRMGPWSADGTTPLTNWSYEVPALNDPLPTDQINPATGRPLTVPATLDHCRMFPLRRYTIYSRTAVGYDGTASNWHGAVPLARLRFNDWAWEALGASLVGETRTMQNGIVELMRLIEDAAAARLDPPALYDDTKVAKTWAQAFNPRKAGARAGADLNSGEIIKYPFPPGLYDVPPWITDWIKQQEERIDYMTGVRDLIAIAKAQQVPGADTLEKLMEMAGPIVQDLVRALELPLQQLGEWRKAYYFQFYTSARMLTITGPDGVEEDVYYVPEQLVPLEKRQDPETQRWSITETPRERSARIGPDTPAQRTARLRRSLDAFRYHVTESGINEIHRMTTKLFYTQLMKLNFPIDWWTFARIAQIPNFGPEPEGTNTVMERYIAQKRIEIDLALDQQQQIAERMGPLAGGGGGIAPGGTPGNAPPTGQAGPGRPPSFSAPPKLETKDGGTRTTIATS